MKDETGAHLRQAYQALGQAILQWESGAYVSTVLKTITDAKEALEKAEERLSIHSGD